MDLAFTLAVGVLLAVAVASYQSVTSLVLYRLVPNEHPEIRRG